MLCKNHKGSFVNGDMGFITEYQERAYDEQTGAVIRNAYTIRFDNPCDVEGNIYTMTVSRKMLQSEFALAYAMTVHKSQGSEFKAVVIGVEQFRTRGRFLQRNLLYTAVTRAKKNVVSSEKRKQSMPLSLPMISSSETRSSQIDLNTLTWKSTKKFTKAA